MQDDSKHVAEADRVLGNRKQFTSQTNADTHLSDKEVSTNALVKSNKFCIREDLAKEKMVFSQESSQAVFETDTLGLIEVKTTMIQCPSCLHYVLKRDNSLTMQEAHRPGYDATNQSCF